MNGSNRRVVVITGASSGIGRATALQFARAGAAVVLLARRDEALDEVAADCESSGGVALAVQCDVSDEAQVRSAAEAATSRFGRIDVWVNNAAVLSFGAFEEIPPEVWRQVVEVDLFGYVHGARAALAQFRRQHHGVLINHGSVVARIAEPFVSPYVASNHAIRGLSESLRQELYLQGEKNIHVCVVMPATIDTPFFQHAANFVGRRPNAMPPVYPAEKVAKTIVKLADRPKREVVVGNAGRKMLALWALLPGLAERRVAKQFNQKHLQQQEQPPTRGNVHAPVAFGTEVDGGWREKRRRKLAMRLAAGAAAAAALAAPVAAVQWARS